MNNYTAPFLLKNGHLNTVYPTLFRRQSQPEYERIEITTSDNDFLHVDCLLKANRRCVILCHGLEGSSQSKYIIGAAKLMSENNWDVVAVNYRSCSGPMNRNLRMYHSGATDDLKCIVDNFSEQYDQIVLAGFSLGGNLCLKFAGEYPKSVYPNISHVIAVSVPVDLEAGSRNIGHPTNFIYERKFLVTLRKKIEEKHLQHPEEIDLSLLSNVKTLYDFDDYFTGPIHGFKDAQDYYTQCSSIHFLKLIDRPAHIITALDDPFLPEACYPYNEVKGNSNLKLITPKNGGHVGFVLLGQKYYWIEKMILNIASGN